LLLHRRPFLDKGQIKSRGKGSQGLRCKKDHYNTLIRELEKRGFQTLFEEHGTTVWVEQESIRLELYEPAKRQTPKTETKWGYQYWDYLPTGSLTLTLWSYYLGDFQTSWSDTKSKSLEERLGKVVALFEKKAAPTTATI